MAEETNKRLSNACAVSFTLHKVSFFVISALTYSGESFWFKRILTLLNISTISAQNLILQDIMRTVACILLLFAFGVANPTEDQVTSGKRIHLLVYYYTLNLSW